MTETATLVRPPPRIDHPAELERVVGRLVERLDPVAIYLFGSRARGEGEADSDYDLMVVLPDDAPDEARRLGASEVRGDDRLPMDLIPATATGFARSRHHVGTLAYEVDHDGMRLHPSGNRPIWIELAPPEDEPAAMNRRIVNGWLRKVERDLRMARLACDDRDPMTDQAAYHIQQAAEKLAKAALAAHRLRTRKTHKIKDSAERLPEDFPDRARFLALDRFSEYAWSTRYPEEDGGPPPPADPSVTEAGAWIAEIEALKADLVRWLEQRAGAEP